MRHLFIFYADTIIIFVYLSNVFITISVFLNNWYFIVMVENISFLYSNEEYIFVTIIIVCDIHVVNRKLLDVLLLV